MRPKYQNLTIADPRHFDGNVFEVAARAAKQAAAVAEVLKTCIDDAEIMARNAHMERILMAGHDDALLGWEESPQERKFEALTEQSVAIQKALTALETAAGYNPKT